MKKLQPHKDITNKLPRVLIIGYGWVGRFIGSYFKDGYYTDADETVRKISNNEPVKINSFDFAFVCVPTPMLPSGQCDTSIVESVVEKWKNRVKYFCIKSTVEVGTVDRLEKKLGVRMCFSPEYLGETVGHPLVEPRRETFIILGGKKRVTKKFAELWTLVTNSYTKIYQVDSKTAELCKLMENSWIGVKVMFVNEFFELAESEGLDFNKLREIWLADPRVSRSHTYVYRHNRGFSGKCLPKDLNNLVNHFKGKAKLMEFILKYNSELRKDYNDSVPLLPYEDKK